MTDLILHQYQSSPFSEKVRCLLGYKGIDYKAVEIPVIMPKPDLMALTGGYRKTPVLQHGSDIYCDSAMICRFIEQIAPAKPVFAPAKAATLSAAAHWTDTFLFRVAVCGVPTPKQWPPAICSKTWLPRRHSCRTGRISPQAQPHSAWI